MVPLLRLLRRMTSPRIVVLLVTLGAGLVGFSRLARQSPPAAISVQLVEAQPVPSLRSAEERPCSGTLTPAQLREALRTFREEDDGVFSLLACGDSHSWGNIGAPSPIETTAADCAAFFDEPAVKQPPLPAAHAPQLFDAFIFNGEVDVLLMRLFELQNVVTKFVILESTFTFVKRPKALLFPRYYKLFAQYYHLIHYVVVDHIPCHLDATWPTEIYIRNQLYRGVQGAMDSIALTAAERARALVAVSDVDEIPHHLDYWQARTCPGWLGHAPLKLRLLNYKYKFLWQDADWERGARMAPFSMLRAEDVPATGSHLYTPEELRMIERVPGAGQFARQSRGWHCGYFMTAQAIFRKSRGFSHQELRMPSLEEIEGCIHHGCWIFGNASARGRVPADAQSAEAVARLPAAVQAHPACFSRYTT